MTQQWSLPAWAVLLPAAVGLLLLVGLAVVLARTRAHGRRVEARLGATEAETTALRVAVTRLEERPPARTSPAAASADPDFVITRLGDDPAGAGPDGEPVADEPAGPTRVVAAPLFADLVLRESVVQAASLAAGVRRAMAPETRHRVRLEMKRDVKRARKQRRADLKAARRDLQARQRAAVDQDSAA